jgi:hypothetical protein
MANGQLVGYLPTTKDEYLQRRREVTVAEDAANLATSKYFGTSLDNSVLSPYATGKTPADLIAEAANLNLTGGNLSNEEYARAFLKAIGVDDAETMNIGEELIREIIDFSSFSSLATTSGALLPIYSEDGTLIGWQWATGENGEQIDLASMIANEKYQQEFNGMTPTQL